MASAPASASAGNRSLDVMSAPAASVRSYGRRVAELGELHPSRPAIIGVTRDGHEQAITWSEYHLWSNAVARMLQRAGVREGSYVVVGLPNGVEHYVATAASWKLGACVLALSPKLPERERDAILSLLDVAAIVADWPGTGAVSTVALRDARASREISLLPDRTAQPARAVASGGSTGRPKIILLPEPMAGIPDDLGLIGEVCGMRPQQVQLVAGPLYHNMPQNLSHVGLFHDHTLVVMERFDAALAAELIERHRVNFAALVPTHMSRMAKLPDIGLRGFSSVEAIFHSAAACPPWVKRAWIDLVGARKVYEGYGATEAVGVCAIRGDEWLEHPGSVGRPRNSSMKILDTSGRELPPGEVGEIFSRMHGGGASYQYIGAAPAKTTDDGFTSVGDLGWVDADGYLYISDRRLDLIISGGANIYPAEVEAAISEHPAVADVAVIGLPDEDLGQRVHAVVELREGFSADAEDLTQFCQQRLERGKTPRAFEFVRQLPRNDAGKIRRSDLARERSPRPGASAPAFVDRSQLSK